MPATLDEIYAFEGNLERGFVDLLKAGGFANVASSRDSEEFSAPWISLWITNGETLDHQHAFPDGRLVWDTFSATLTTECVTHRKDDLLHRNHRLFLARMRKQLQMFRLAPNWSNSISLTVDIREGGTIDTWDDENDLDHSLITWNLRHSINPSAWPANVDVP